MKATILALPFLLLASGCAHSHPKPLAPAAAPQALEKARYPVTQIYIPDGTIDAANAIPPPPTPGSATNRMDYAKLFRYQKTRTARQCERAATEVYPDLENFYGPKYGPLSEEQVRQWSKFLDGAVRSDANYCIQSVKKHWNRPRPYIADTKIVPCIKTEGRNPSYPSGHAAISQVYALILEKLDPQRRKAIETRNLQISRDRVLGGVHHPTDVLYGRKLGREIFRAFMKNAAFRKDLAALRSERALGPN